MLSAVNAASLLKHSPTAGNISRKLGGNRGRC